MDQDCQLLNLVYHLIGYTDLISITLHHRPLSGKQPPGVELRQRFVYSFAVVRITIIPFGYRPGGNTFSLLARYVLYLLVYYIAVRILSGRLFLLVVFVELGEQTLHQFVVAFALPLHLIHEP